MQFLVMNKYFRRQSLENPGVSESLIGTHTCQGVPVETLTDEIDERLVICLEYIREFFAAGHSDLVFAIWHEYGSVIVVEELFLALAGLEYFGCRFVAYFHHHGKLFHFIFAREERVSNAEFRHDASEAPHIDGGGVRNSEYDFGCAVEARLNVCVDAFVGEAGRAEVDYFDAGLGRVLEQYVLRFQVAMDDVILLEVL